MKILSYFSHSDRKSITPCEMTTMTMMFCTIRSDRPRLILKCKPMVAFSPWTGKREAFRPRRKLFVGVFVAVTSQDEEFPQCQRQDVGVDRIKRLVQDLANVRGFQVNRPVDHEDSESSSRSTSIIMVSGRGWQETSTPIGSPESREVRTFVCRDHDEEDACHGRVGPTRSF